MISVQSTHTEGVYDADDERLLSTIAANVGVALQNARLFNETKEALERQTATTEVLKVISESPTDVQPVFDIIAERAALLTGAPYCLVLRFDGEWLHLASLYGVNPQGRQALSQVWPQRVARQYLDLGARDTRPSGGQRGRPAGRVRHRLRAADEAGGRAGRLSQRPERADAARPAG